MHQKEDIHRSHMDTTPYYQQITSSMLQDQNQIVNPLRKHEDHDDEINMAALASSPSGSSTSNDDLANCHLTTTISGSKQRASLKCPRCDSTDTKFCYFNNYSQKQPRHYCKTCKRYWTDGGALRNVPVGGGCRKNKRGKHRSMPGMLDPSVYGEEINIMGMWSQRAFSSFGGGTTSFEGDQTGNIPSMNFQNPINYSNPHFSLPVSQFLDGVSPAKYSLCRMQNSFGCIDVAACSNCAQAAPPQFIDNLTGRTLNFDMSDYGNLGQPSNSLVDQGTCNAYFNAGNCMRPCGLTSSATATLASIEDQLMNYLAPASLSSGSSQLPLEVVRQPEGGQPKVVEKDFQELIRETTVKGSSYHDCGEEGLISLDAGFKNKQKEEDGLDENALLDQLLAADESMRNFIDPQAYEQDGQHAFTTEEEQVEEFLVEKPMMGYMDFSSDAPLIMNDKVPRTDATIMMDDKVPLAGAVMMMKDEELPVALVDGPTWTSAELQATRHPAQAASGHPGLVSTPAQQYIQP